MSIDIKILKDRVADQFKDKEKLIAPNVQALELGFQYATIHFNCPLPVPMPCMATSNRYCCSRPHQLKVSRWPHRRLIWLNSCTPRLF
ncbi:MAG: hypothetical protein JKY94_13050 [Rhodobacteraceae bacterium]|nr:hypothetical protein [Paracoccaceae bacterium]